MRSREHFAPPEPVQALSETDEQRRGERQDGSSVKAAYHAGPPELWFGGRYWLRGEAQELGAGEWERLQSRDDFVPFDFRTI